LSAAIQADKGFVSAVTKLLGDGLRKAEARGAPRVLFSAHGLPERVIAGGDPYQHQIEMTAQAVMTQLNRPEHHLAGDLSVTGWALEMDRPVNGFRNCPGGV